jgi:A/G-specific adenine glycosylase
MSGSAQPKPAALLAWYDRHRRRLPWRALPGETADPYRVWLSEIMLQQTTVQAVKPYFEAFLSRFPTVEALAEAPAEEVMRLWAGLGYYSRARNLHACARAVVERFGGRFPAEEAALLALPGIGAYTAAAVSAIAFDRRAVVVDGNVERVVTRLYAVEEPLPAAKPIVRRLAEGLTPELRPGDFAQAMMDLGATLCTPRRPSCALCPFIGACQAQREGRQEEFPRKAPKRQGALRRGLAFVAVRADGAVLARTRPLRGLLGGMSEVPTSAWTAGAGPWSEPEAAAAAPFQAAWRLLSEPARHAFTHFPLELQVLRVDLPADAPKPDGLRWVRRIEDEAFPTVFRKVLAIGMA